MRFDFFSILLLVRSDDLLILKKRSSFFLSLNRKKPDLKSEKWCFCALIKSIESVRFSPPCEGEWGFSALLSVLKEINGLGDLRVSPPYFYLYYFIVCGILYIDNLWEKICLTFIFLKAHTFTPSRCVSILDIVVVHIVTNL